MPLPVSLSALLHLQLLPSPLVSLLHPPQLPQHLLPHLSHLLAFHSEVQLPLDHLHPLPLKSPRGLLLQHSRLVRSLLNPRKRRRYNLPNHLRASHLGLLPPLRRLRAIMHPSRQDSLLEPNQRLT